MKKYMKIDRQDLPQSQVQLSVNIPAGDFQPYLAEGAESLSKEIKVEGFRPGKVPYDILKAKVGEMAILEEAAHIAIRKTIDKVIAELKDKQPIGQPSVEITKLAPGNDLEYKITLAIMPEVKLGEYKDLKIKEDKPEVGEKEISKALNDLAESRATEVLSEGGVKENGKAIVDIDLFLGNVPAENGQAKDVAIILGKDYFVPGFDKEILGHKKGDELTFKLPFPADHHQKHLAGKMVDFKVKVKEVYDRTIAEINDNLAKGFGLKTLEDLKKFFLDNMKHRAEDQARDKSELAMLDKIVEKTKFGDIPEMLVTHETELMLDELSHSIEHQGGKMEDYLKSIGKSYEQLTIDFMPQAVKRVKVALMMREVAKSENIIITPEEIEKKLEDLKVQYKGDENVQKMVKETSYKNYVGNILANQKVIKKLREWNIA
jgi:trigger factor